MIDNVKATTLVFGEVLIDLFSGPVDRRTRGLRYFPFEGLPGGAPCNVAAQLAARNRPVSLLTSFADDPLGNELKEMLVERHIDLSQCRVYPQSRSPVATVISLPNGERTFRLYLKGSCLEKLTTDILTDDLWAATDWVHFGSVMMAFPDPNRLTHVLAAEGKARGMITSFDVNVRADLWAESEVDPHTIVEILPHVDVLKVSDEDFAWIEQSFEGMFQHPEDLLDQGPALVAMTRGADGAVLLTRGARAEVAAPSVSVVDTTGAGDAFMAGLIYSLKEHGVRSRADLEGISSAVLQAAAQYASDAAGEILVQRGALPPMYP